MVVKQIRLKIQFKIRFKIQFKLRFKIRLKIRLKIRSKIQLKILIRQVPGQKHTLSKQLTLKIPQQILTLILKTTSSIAALKHPTLFTHLIIQQPKILNKPIHIRNVISKII
jgi:hypothetical protein